MADGASFDRIERARRAILAQIEERDRLFPQTRPAFPWSRMAAANAYVFALPAEHLKSIRLHCDMMLGTHFGDTLFLDFNEKPAAFDARAHYSWLGDGVHPALWAGEPEIEALPGVPLGVEIEGHRVNEFTTIVQRYLCNLLRLGLRDGQTVLEIGAGFGALAHAVLSARRVQYVIVDLPETLIFSAAFLEHHFPGQVYVYHPDDGPDVGAAGGAPIVLLPNYRADLGGELDVAINTVSFPEMSREALTGYLELVARRLKPGGFLMSVNYHGDRGDGLGTVDFLARHFTVSPSRSEIERAMKKTPAEFEGILFRPTMICTRPGEKKPKGRLRDVIACERFEFLVG